MARTAMAQETICALRRKIARIEGALPERLAAPEEGESLVLRRYGRPEGAAAPMSLAETGTPRLDAALGGGILQAALTEVIGRETRDSGIVSGFSLALAAIASRAGAFSAEGARPVLWVATADILAEAGFPYAPSVEQFFGLTPDRLLLVRANRLEDALWAAEEAARLGGFSATFLELRGNPARLDLTATRRLHHRARDAGRPVFLIRHSSEPEPTAAPTRLLVSPAPSSLRETLAGPLPRSIGPPAFAVTLARSRTGKTGTFTLEWNPHDFVFQERWPTGERGSAFKSSRGAQDTGGMATASFDRPDPAPPVRGGLAPARKERRAG
ncbi:ImuA family protein [Chelativorans alearense]|uniref:ImuA family protein n=1 Tax=Chelativorans alearense TaxID=2681495 RepID=UPI001FE470C8|nr:hypothetical protein [Chelativorans alearense]